MRVLAAKDRVDLDDLLLEVEHFKIVRDGKKVHGGRQLHGRMAPVAVLEDAELAARDELLQAVLDVAEVAHGGKRMTRGDFLLDRRGFAGIGLKRRDHVDPVERGELIEVHQMVVHVERGIDQVAHDVGVLRDLDPEGVLDAAHGRKGVNARADAADAFDEGPGVARVAALENDLEASPHRAGAHGVGDSSVVAERGLDAQVTLDSGDRVHNNSAFTHSSLPPMSLLVFLARACDTADMATCAAAATPTTPSVARPTLSAVASMPPQPGGRTVVSCS